MIVIALTGNIASGKTTVARIFEEFDIPVFNSDLAGRKAEEDPIVRQQFLDVVGYDIIVDGVLDRNKMRERVFGDKDLLSKVNAIMTPYIHNKFKEYLSQKEAEGYNLVMIESAIIFELNLEKNFDYVISVIADKMTRAKRAMYRDEINLDMVLKKMDSQLSDDEKILRSDFVIINEHMPFINHMELLRKQVNTILDVISLSNS